LVGGNPARLLRNKSELAVCDDIALGRFAFHSATHLATSFDAFRH